jgi:glyoxylase-like metal-dependent hydrolase (beta-lactamase superfamily II)
VAAKAIIDDRLPVDGLLVDTGCAHSAHELSDKLMNKKLTCILNTHGHEDHIGANGILKRNRTELEVFAHPLALPVLANPRKCQPQQMYRRVFWGWPEPCKGKPVRDGELVETERYRFRVIYTPGHSPDHICLYEQERGWLFTGDLFVGGRDRALRVDCNIWQIIASLKLVAGLQLTRLFPGCARVRDNPYEDLTNKIEYLEETGEKVLKLHKKGLMHLRSSHAQCSLSL